MTMYTDPRDKNLLQQQNSSESNTPTEATSKSDTSSGDKSPQPSPAAQRQFKTSFGQEPVKPTPPPKTWEFNDADTRLWDAGGGNFDMETPIGHAWSRLLRRGIKLGYPETDMIQHTEKRKVNGVEQDVDVYTQGFQHATATFVDNPDLNKNAMVEFEDARGLVGTDSGV